MSDHKCPVNGCLKLIQSELLMCFEHWRMLPRKSQEWVEHLYQMEFGSEQYMKARQDAISHVNGKIDLKMEDKP